MSNPTFSILISTRNRKDDLAFTLEKTRYLLSENVGCTVFDDGSDDGTSDFIKQHFPEIKLLRNETPKGYLFCRNKMLNETHADFAVSLDDDAHFVTQNPLEMIKTHFDEHPHCGLIALRIFWGLAEPEMTFSGEHPQQVQGFVGCAHVWRMQSWRHIPDYPEWFVFYGEEDFAAFQLFRENIEIHYLPQILVNHRVDVKSRKSNDDYTIRLRRSLRSGWYLYFLFHPWRVIPRKMAYSLWIQFRNKIFKGDMKALKAILFASADLLFAFPKIIKSSNRLSMEEYRSYQKLKPAQIFWQPTTEKNEKL